MQRFHVQHSSSNLWPFGLPTPWWPMFATAVQWVHRSDWKTGLSIWRWCLVWEHRQPQDLQEFKRRVGGWFYIICKADIFSANPALCPHLAVDTSIICKRDVFTATPARYPHLSSCSFFLFRRMCTVSQTMTRHSQALHFSVWWCSHLSCEVGTDNSCLSLAVADQQGLPFQRAAQSAGYLAFIISACSSW